MAVVTITKENFEQEVLQSAKPVLLDFWASWCGPCRMLSPVVDEVAEERTDVKVGKVNVDEEPDLARRFGVMSIPTVVFLKNGVEFVANMPTEEIFTAPLKTGINGVVYAAMPLVNDGNIIDKFHFVIRDGKIVEAHAEKGEEFLKAAISVDEGASYFGEVALVPYDSPISNQKILFYNTLFDENASCHLAFGEAYPECIEGGESMTREEVQAHGLNYSMTHVDFMVGTADLSIVGTTHDGREVPVFVNGNFAI